MFKLAEAFVEIGAQMKPFDDAIKSIGNRLNALSRMRFNVPGGGILAALGLSVGGAAIGKAISGASDLAETMSKVSAVFEGSASEVTAAADQMAQAFGIPKREFLDAASQFGLIAKGMGQTSKEAASASVRFAKLAADAASFYNVPVAVALEKIRAGLTGESEPLKAFGVIMDEATTKSAAFSLGLAKQGKDLSNQAKFAARAEIIARGLATATGDLERTSSGAANQSRMFWGQLTNLGDALGTVVLPAATEFLRLLNQIASGLSSAATGGTSAFQGFLDVFRNVMDTAGVIYRNWGAIVQRTGVMIGGYLVNFAERVTWIKDTVAAFLSWFGTNWRTIFADTFNATMTALSNLGKNFQDFGAAAYDWIASGFTKPFEIKMTPILEGFDATTTAFKAPELKLSSVADQLAEIDEQMNKSEQKVADDRAAAEAKATGKAAAATPFGEAPEKEKKTKSEFVGLADFAKKIQAGALDGKNKPAEDTAKNTTKMVAILDDMRKHPRAAGPAVAVGPA